MKRIKFDEFGNELYRITSNEIPIEIQWEFGDDEQEALPYVTSRQGKMYLEEFMRIEGNTEFGEFDGIRSDSFFSGTLIKLDYGGDTARLYHYSS